MYMSLLNAGGREKFPSISKGGKAEGGMRGVDKGSKLSCKARNKRREKEKSYLNICQTREGGIGKKKNIWGCLRKRFKK